MINRLLIRIKIVQLVYASLQSDETRNVSHGELMRSMESAYKLYNYLLALIVLVTDFRRTQLDETSRKYTATDEERNPNRRFVDNKVADELKQHSGVIEYCKEQQLIDDFDTDLYRALTDSILATPHYQAYMESPYVPDLEDDKRLWREILNTVFPACEKLESALEEKDIYWNDDFCVINAYVEKTVQRMLPGKKTVRVFPMFKNEEDKTFATSLFDAAIAHAGEYIALIEKTSDNWDVNRIALMDRIIMVCAIAEVIHCPDIPTTITLNEYIELAKHYSTPDSAKFINGILDRVVKTLREEGKIVKA